MKEEEKLVQAKGITKQNRTIKFKVCLTLFSPEGAQSSAPTFRA